MILNGIPAKLQARDTLTWYSNTRHIKVTAERGAPLVWDTGHEEMLLPMCRNSHEFLHFAHIIADTHNLKCIICKEDALIIIVKLI